MKQCLPFGGRVKVYIARKCGTHLRIFYIYFSPTPSLFFLSLSLFLSTKINFFPPWAYDDATDVLETISSAGHAGMKFLYEWDTLGHSIEEVRTLESIWGWFLFTYSNYSLMEDIIECKRD